MVTSDSEHDASSCGSQRGSPLSPQHEPLISNGDEKPRTLLAEKQLAISTDSGTDYIEREWKRLEEEHDMLRQQIETARKRRFELRRATDEVAQHRVDWTARHRSAEIDFSYAVSEYKSAVMQRQAVSMSLGVARKLCPTADCFYIWHRGPFGTINGLRLGSEVPSIPSSAFADEDSTASSIAANGDHGGSSATGTGSPETIRVPWAEVNAALGMTSLLLATLEKKSHSGIQFRTHEIIPLGNFSKIGAIQPDGRPPVLYNLFYSDDSFQFFGKRNFNTALDGLFHCLMDAADAVERIDKTIVLPHKVEISSRGEVTIGGLPVSFGVDGGTWTRAMKYFLTDLKWLIAFTTKNSDR